ncbi:hypothetical protein Bca52824_000668 [Brassica carinata]|uniref:FKB95-like N-terminal Kelch domain-containing protein n=1 Tax=Brassica carinata TaxID=52824 RepID=A0A8X7WJX1_BRACI|nr:hypothetical protein Bca52824_000668 [Brassica carinata]
MSKKAEIHENEKTVDRHAESPLNAYKHALSLSLVSKHLRALVRSPELEELRSVVPHKSSLYVCFRENNSSFHWLTLRPNDDETSTTTTTEYRLVPNPTPFPPHKYGSSTVTVGSKIFFIGGSTEPSTDLWILDTRTGNMTQGPCMSVPRVERKAAVGVIDRMIYVIGGGLGSNKEIQVEVFDPKSETWELAGHETVSKSFRCGASVERKVYIVEYDKTSVYNPRNCEGKRLIHMGSKRLSEGGRMDTLYNRVNRGVCVVDNILFSYFKWSGILWFNTKLKVWRRLVGLDGKDLFFLHADTISEYDGRLVVLSLSGESKVGNTITKSVRCMLVSLHRAGERVCATIDWSGIVATVPYRFRFLHCLAVSE